MGIRICPECSGKVSTTLDTCPHCGYKFNNKIKCPECEELIDINSSACPICGFKLNEKATIMDISCPNCGSNDFISIDDYYKCNSCDSSFKIDNGYPIIINNIVNNIYKDKEDCELPNKISVLKSTYSEKDFKLGVYEFLKDNYSTPSNIFDYDFSEVSTFTVDCLISSGEGEVSYSRSIGYDHIEHYTEYEEKYNKDTGKYDKVPVTKTKTVTDWRPDNGIVKGKSTQLSINEEDPLSILEGSIIKSISGFDLNSSITGVEESSVLQATIDDVKSGMESDIYYSEASKLGDHIRGESYSGDIVLKTAYLFRIPCYKMTISFNNHTYNILACAINEPNIIFDERYPKFPTIERDEAHDSKVEEFEKKEGILNVFFGVFVGLSILTFIVGFALAAVTEYFYFTFIGIGVFMILAIILKIMAKVEENKEDKYSSEFREESNNLKEIGYQNKVKEL